MRGQVGHNGTRLSKNIGLSVGQYFLSYVATRLFACVADELAKPSRRVPGLLTILDIEDYVDIDKVDYESIRGNGEIPVDSSDGRPTEEWSGHEWLHNPTDGIRVQDRSRELRGNSPLLPSLNVLIGSTSPTAAPIFAVVC